MSAWATPDSRFGFVEVSLVVPPMLPATKNAATRTTTHAPSTVQRRRALKCASLPVMLLLLLICLPLLALKAVLALIRWGR